MKKTLKILMLIGIIALGINLTEVKAEEVTAPVTTAPQETTTAPESMNIHCCISCKHNNGYLFLLLLLSLTLSL